MVNVGDGGQLFNIGMLCFGTPYASVDSRNLPLNEWTPVINWKLIFCFQVLTVYFQY